MCERSWSEGGGDVDKLPAHIRDALKSAEESSGRPADVPAEVKEVAEARGSVDEATTALQAEVERHRERCIQLERREASLESKLKERDREVDELRCYVHDALRLHERDHAYLRATHLDPAIGLEIELLKDQIKRFQAEVGTKRSADDDLLYEKDELERQNAALAAQNDELAAAAAAAESERNHLRLRLQELREELNVAREWNDQLEEEREELYGMLDDAKRRLPDPDVYYRADLHQASTAGAHDPYAASHNDQQAAAAYYAAHPTPPGSRDWRDQHAAGLQAPQRR